MRIVTGARCSRFGGLLRCGVAGLILETVGPLGWSLAGSVYALFGWLAAGWVGCLSGFVGSAGWLAQPANAWSQAQGPSQKEVGGGLALVF